MTSLPGEQKITTHILLNISQIKGNQATKLGQLIDHPKRNIFLWKLFRKWSTKTSSRLLFVLLKSFILGKNKWFAAWFHYISIALKLAYNRNKLFKTLHYWSRDMLNFDFLDKSLGIVSPAHFVYDFSTKVFLMLNFINWRNYLVAFTSLDIRQNVYLNCLLSRLWRHGFWS